MMNKFVFDTNTLISAFLFSRSIPRSALDLALERGHLVSSLGAFEEFNEVLSRPKFDRYIAVSPKQLVLDEFRSLIHFQEVSEVITDCRDPKDNKFLELAVASNASCIITGDQDLLVLNPFRGILILNAADFIGRFRG